MTSNIYLTPGRNQGPLRQTLEEQCSVQTTAYGCSLEASTGVRIASIFPNDAKTPHPTTFTWEVYTIISTPVIYFQFPRQTPQKIKTSIRMHTVLTDPYFLPLNPSMWYNFLTRQAPKYIQLEVLCFFSPLLTLFALFGRVGARGRCPSPSKRSIRLFKLLRTGESDRKNRRCSRLPNNEVAFFIGAALGSLPGAAL